MELVTTLAKYGIIIEIMLIFFIILSTYVFKIVNYFKAISKKSMILEIELYLREKMRINEQVTDLSFKNKWKKIQILLMVIKKLDNNAMIEDWLQIKTNFIRSIMLPLAREAAFSEDWAMRFAAAQVFTLYSENGDEIFILKLLKDEIPLVSYLGANAAITFGSKEALDLIITQMSKNSWLTQSLYMQAFDNAPYATCYFISKMMKSTDNFTIRSICYNILLKYPTFLVDWDINEDIESKNIILVLSAIRYIAYSQPVIAAPILIRLLDHPQWQVKAVALCSLTKFDAASAIPKIELCLNNSNWWVALAAQQVLQKLTHEEPAFKSNETRINRVLNSIEQSIFNTF